MDTWSRGRSLVVVVLLVVALLGGQAAADSILPMGGGGDTERAVGDAGFAYLTGIRKAVAAMLWNRLEPQFHEYYGEIPLDEQEFLFPTIAVVLTLDPELEQAYYVAPWVLARRGDVPRGMELAKLGVEAVPDSALIRASYAQMIAAFEKDYDKAAEQADVAVGLEWSDPIDEHNYTAILRSIYKNAGRMDMYEALGRRLEELDRLYGDEFGAETGHDHDGDGVPDH